MWKNTAEEIIEYGVAQHSSRWELSDARGGPHVIEAPPSLGFFPSAPQPTISPG
jgi:hypothetical protein